MTPIVPGQSSHAQRASGSFALMDADSGFPSPVSCRSGRDSFDAGSPPESLSTTTSGPWSQTADRRLQPQTDSPIITQPANTQHRANKRSRTGEPRDSRAAKRLRRQRESDDDNIERLMNLFVPKSVERGMKKDRLSLGIVLSFRKLGMITTNCSQLYPMRQCTWRRILNDSDLKRLYNMEPMSTLAQPYNWARNSPRKTPEVPIGDSCEASGEAERSFW
jgi:hypothetical protein